MKRKSTSQKEVEGGTLAEQIESDLSRIRQTLRKPLEAEVARGKLTAPQIGAMREVVRHDGISLKDLSRAMSLAHSTVSGIVDRLEKRGMVARRVDASDGRISRVYPTAVVSDFVRDQLPILMRRPLETALERATEAERAMVGSAVKRLRELLEEAGSESAS
jgi:DNA-binding MarR family transcriptional regulator